MSDETRGALGDQRRRDDLRARIGVRPTRVEASELKPLSAAGEALGRAAEVLGLAPTGAGELSRRGPAGEQWLGWLLEVSLVGGEDVL